MLRVESWTWEESAGTVKERTGFSVSLQVSHSHRDVSVSVRVFPCVVFAIEIEKVGVGSKLL